MTTHSINAELCTKCGSCVAVCPCWVYERADDHIAVREENEGICVRCGHCMAICPTQAVRVEGLDYEQFEELDGDAATPEALEALMRRRRAMRAFDEKPVPGAVLRRIVDGAATAPMGFPPSEVEVTVLATREHVAAAVASTAQACEGLVRMMDSPVGRLIFRLMARGKDRVIVQDYLLPFLRPALQAYTDRGVDVFTWGATAMLIFHSARSAAAGETDCVLAAAHAMLVAEALGLGTIMLGTVQFSIQRDKALRASYGIPEANDVFNVLALGYQSRRFRRTIPRAFRSVNWVGGGSHLERI